MTKLTVCHPGSCNKYFILNNNIRKVIGDTVPEKRAPTKKKHVLSQPKEFGAHRDKRDECRKTDFAGFDLLITGIWA